MRSARLAGRLVRLAALALKELKVVLLDRRARITLIAGLGITGLGYVVRVLLDAEDRASGLKALGALTEDLASGVRRG